MPTPSTIHGRRDLQFGDTAPRCVECRPSDSSCRWCTRNCSAWRAHLACERGHTLQPTALVHEAYLKLVDQRAVNWQNRAHFFAISAQLMRRIVMKRARHRHAAKRGGGVADVSIDDDTLLSDDRTDNLVALDDALNRLAVIDPRQSRIVELRFFGGLTVEETAEVIDVAREIDVDIL